MNKLFDFILTLLYVLAGLHLLFITFSIGYTIIARFFGFSGMMSVLQFTEYSLLWITLLGATFLLKNDDHVMVDLIYGNVSFRAKKILRLLHSLLGIPLCGTLFWYGSVVTWGQYQRGIVDIQVVDFPKFIVLSIIPICFFLLSIEYVRKFIFCLKNFRKE